MEEKKNHKEHPQAPNQKEELITIKQSEYAGLKEEAKKAEDQMLRNQAELENIRKRLEKDKQDFVKFANEGLILELLNVLDDLERTVNLAESIKQDFTSFLKGVEMILAHLYEMLKEHGVQPIDAEGKIFDPHYHEALMQAENKELPEHTIIEVLQKGYLMNERVIRTAKVKVSKITEDRGQRTEDRKS